MSDQEIFKQICLGDEQALEVIYQKYYRMMVRLVVTNSGTEQEAKDVYQEAVVVFWQKAISGNLVLTSKISTYLYSICLNLWRKELERKSRHSNEEKDEDSEKKRMAEQLKTQQEELKKQAEQMAEMMKQQQEFMKMMTGETGLNKTKSNDSEESGNSSPKKKKGSKGLAESSSSVGSDCTRRTRGSAARDEKRKQNEKKKRSKQW